MLLALTSTENGRLGISCASKIDTFLLFSIGVVPYPAACPDTRSSALTTKLRRRVIPAVIFIMRNGCSATGILKAAQVGDTCCLRLFKPPPEGELGASPVLFAECVVRLDKGRTLQVYVESVIDSSR